MPPYVPRVLNPAASLCLRAAQWREVCSGRWIFQRLADHVCEAALHPRWQVSFHILPVES